MEGLLSSIEKISLFCEKKKFCKEITSEYYKRIISVYYNINQNPRTRINPKCEFEKIPIKSIFGYRQIELKLAEYLVEKNQIINIEEYFNNQDLIVFQKVGPYYGMPDIKEMLQVGVYTFFNAENNDEVHFLILREGSYDFLDVTNSTAYDLINEIILLGEEHKYCHTKTISIIDEVISIFNNSSCFDVIALKFDLP